MHNTRRARHPLSGSVAQLVEQGTENSYVVGSIPTGFITYLPPWEKYIKKEVLIIIKITQSEAQLLRNADLGDCVKISSVTHKSRAKRYWAVEEPEVLQLLDQNAKNSIVR